MPIPDGQDEGLEAVKRLCETDSASSNQGLFVSLLECLGLESSIDRIIDTGGT